ncbi:MAG: hypothetical protein A2008_11045 [Candidatus Wallbacteria bacterium GWC2_49_35]|uniref:SbsA Ig-like domain-containing protein n=1 Tax=Candidatus Wallbacteria bacterium GWC2_49_35 TaxID=1817813 RepID=A0A1F7WSU6_9BACT|nr:MAG: hypothetical protein A2008_11045 [Candidatus Wallbacteria bacterium GWC2_49_35]HBC73375.1 hypothetical protein [Candidatus Wallbacteria bacterium]
MFNQRSVLKKLACLLSLVFVFAMMAGCGGGGSTNAVVNEQVPLSGSNTVIADTIKMEKQGDNLVINYQTSAPVKNAHIVTSSFSFNNVPLWSDFHKVISEDGLKHTATVKVDNSKHFMIYASAQDKYDNGGKGLEIK